MKQCFPIYVLLLVCLVAQGCSQQGAPDSRIRIICSIVPHYSFASAIVGDTASVELLASPSVGPHSYHLTLQDRKRLNSCDVFVLNGLELETSFSSDFLTDLKKEGVIVVHAAETLPVSELVPLGTEAQLSSSYDPHTWLSEAGAISSAQAIHAGIVQADPAHEDEYTQGLTRLETRIRNAFEKARQKLSGLENRTILPYHDAWAYFAREFRLDIPTTVTLSGRPISISKRLELEELIRNGNVRAIFTEPQFKPLEAEFLTRETGVSLATLDPGVTSAKQPSDDTYFDVLNANVEELLRVLAVPEK